MKPAVYALVALACPACFTTSTPERHALEDTGRACAFAIDPSMTANPSQQMFIAGKPIVFRAILDDCLFACSQNIVATCSVARSGNAIHVTSHGTWTERHTPDTGCVGVCLELAASCSTGPLEEGTYTIDYAGASMQVTVPGTAPEAPCTPTSSP